MTIDRSLIKRLSSASNAGSRLQAAESDIGLWPGASLKLALVDSVVVDSQLCVATSLSANADGDVLIACGSGLALLSHSGSMRRQSIAVATVVCQFGDSVAVSVQS